MSGNTSTGTRCELLLDEALCSIGLHPQRNREDLPGKPDFVFLDAKLVVFVDGDFWHGRNWEHRKAKLSMGSNAEYWIAKIQSNIDRDRRQETQLSGEGWAVMRLWETEVLKNLEDSALLIAEKISRIL